jgi:hypothetical protein
MYNKGDNYLAFLLAKRPIFLDFFFYVRYLTLLHLPPPPPPPLRQLDDLTILGLDLIHQFRNHCSNKKNAIQRSYTVLPLYSVLIL